MRQLFSLLFVLVLIFTSCERDDKLASSQSKITLSEQSVELEFESQEHSVYVTSSDFWIATSQNEWITIITDRGVAGSQELKFSVECNYELESRTGIIIIENEAGTSSVQLSVEQAAFQPSDIDIPINYLQFRYEGGEQEIVISANFEYDVDVNCNWVSYEILANGIAVIVEPSTVCQSRYAEIVIYKEKYDISESITIEQRAFEPYLDIAEISELNFDYKGGIQTIPIESSFEYEVISDADWLTIDITSAGVKVSVEPIFPVLNRPRTASIQILDSQYGCEGADIVVSQSGKESDFQIGEMLEYSGSVGVVFYRDTYTTKIVSVEQSRASWSVEYVAIGASDSANGMNNMAVVQAIASWESKYPAFAWCANLGEGWYLPAKNELSAIYAVKSAINETLISNGYTTVGTDHNYYYWSSTQKDANNAYKLYLSTGVSDHYYKSGEYFVRAVYCF